MRLLPQIPEDGWQRLEVGDGSKGPRVYDWACARLPYLTEDGLGAVAAAAALRE